MYKIPFAISVILAFVLLYNILKIAFDVEDKNVTEVYKKARIKKKLFKNPRHIFSKYIKISNYKKQQYEADLFSLNMDITPQEYISESIFGTIIFWWANKKIWRTQLKNCIIILDKNTIKGGSPYE